MTLQKAVLTAALFWITTLGCTAAFIWVAVVAIPQYPVTCCTVLGLGGFALTVWSLMKGKDL